MLNIKTARERYRVACQQRVTWFETQRRLEAERDRLAAEIPTFEKRKDDAEKAKNSALTAYVSGTNKQADVDAARKALSDVQDQENLAKDMKSAIDRGLHENELRLNALNQEKSSACVALCAAHAGPIEARLLADKKLQADLLAVFTCYAAACADTSNSSARVRWDLILMDIAPEPSGDVLEQHIAQFVAENITPIQNDTTA